VKLSEGNMQCPLFGSDLPQTIERQVDAFSNADSGDASQQESVGIQAVCVAHFFLEQLIVFRRQRPGEILRTNRKIFANDETGLEKMALGGQVVEQAAKTEQTLLAGMIPDGRTQLAKPAEPAQHMGITTEL
jgi:hypothetical protein